MTTLNRPPATWSEVHQIKDDATKIVVVISKSTHYPFPRYSLRVGTEWPNTDRAPEMTHAPRPPHNALRLFFNPRVHDQAKGQANLGDEFERLGVLLDQAKEWIQTDAGYIANQVLDARITRDENQANRGKPQTNQTGKTERNREKGKARRADT